MTPSLGSRFRYRTSWSENSQSQYQPSECRQPAWNLAEQVAPRLEFNLNALQGGPFGIEWTLNDRARTHDYQDPGTQQVSSAAIQMAREASVSDPRLKKLTEATCLRRSGRSQR